MSGELGADWGGAAGCSEAVVVGVGVEGTGLDGAAVGAVGVEGTGGGGVVVVEVELPEGNSSAGGDVGREGLGGEGSSNFASGHTSDDTSPCECGGSGSVGASVRSIF